MRYFTPIILLAVVFSVQAQDQQMLGEAFSEFATRLFWEYEQVDISWKMEGRLQADLNEGYNNLKEDKPEMAAHDFTKVLNVDSSIWEAYYYRAAAHKQLKKFPNAKADLNRAIALHPNFYEGRIELAKIHYLMHQLDESERQLRKATQLNPAKPTAYYLRGDINLTQNQIKEAKKNYQDCLKNDSLFHDARIKLALLDLSTKNDQSKAIGHLNQVLKYDSLQKTALLFRSILIYDQNKKQCEKDLSTLISVSPNNLMASYLRGMVHTELEEFDKAFSDFQKVIKATEANENTFKGQQSWLDKKIDIQNAGAYMLTRIYGLPDRESEKVKQAYCYIVINQLDKSISQLDQVRINNEPVTPYLKAVAYEHRGVHANAYRFYNEALALDNEILDAYKKRGIYELELKNYEKSIQDFSKILKLTPDVFVVYKLRGLAYFHSVQFKKAADDFDRYLKYDSSNSEVISSRGMAYLKINQRLKAYEDFAQSNNAQAFNYQDMSYLVDSVLATGDTLQVLRCLNKFVKASPYYTEGFIKKFKILQLKNEWNDIEQEVAIALRNEMVGVPKTHHSYLLTLQGVILVKNKHLDDALKTFNEAIKFDKANALAFLERGKVWQSMGKESKAATDIKRAAELGNRSAKELLNTLPINN
ncbi:MAG: tetratricopeptide repeat protein [Cyclobacteriaceae bacterium]|nr:tetratricopeptide repeat protein [Cyclobacteriaceae bacterium]